MRGARGAERFEARPGAERFLPFVGECLRTFTPWETRCIMPAAFDARCDELPPLRFNGKDPDAERTVEAARFHSLLHPDCYTRLLAALLLDAPARRLELPDFHLPDREPPGGENDRELRRPTAELSEEEMERTSES